MCSEFAPTILFELARSRRHRTKRALRLSAPGITPLLALDQGVKSRMV